MLTKKSLCAAVLAGLLSANTAEAVHVSADGVGSVLIYPYYTVRSPKGNAASHFDTYVSVTNKTSQAKALKVRFREGRRGADVLDFNLFLSGHDMWTGAVVSTANGAMLISIDNSCTVPSKLFALKDPATPAALDQATPNVFKNYQYQTAFDGNVLGLDRTREGHFEVIEMGVITESAQIAALTHNANGIPANCGLFQSLDNTLGNTLIPPSGGLFGRASLLSATTGAHFAYDATALAQWSDVVKYTETASALPAITEASPAVSRVITDQGIVQANWNKPEDAVSAVLMQSELSNEFVLDTGTLSGTDWVITFPTKSAYVLPGNGLAKAPFYGNYHGTSWELLGSTIYDREGSKPETEVFPTVPPELLPGNLIFRWTSNSLTFAGYRQSFGSTNFTSNLLGSELAFSFNVNKMAGFSAVQNGWAQLTFKESYQSITPASASLLKLDGTVSKIKGTHYGLPLVGFMVHDYINNTVPGSSYGGLLHHKTSTEIDLMVVP